MLFVQLPVLQAVEYNKITVDQARPSRERFVMTIFALAHGDTDLSMCAKEDVATRRVWKRSIESEQANHLTSIILPL